MVLGPFSLPDSIEVTSRFSWPASITIYNVLLPYSLPATVDTTPEPSSAIELADSDTTVGAIGSKTVAWGGGLMQAVTVWNVELIPLTPPAAVVDLAGVAGDTEVALSWTAPDDGGAAISDYIVQYRALD